MRLGKLGKQLLPKRHGSNDIFMRDVYGKAKEDSIDNTEFWKHVICITSMQY